MKKFFGLVVVLFATLTIGYGQAISVNGGSIQGTITDPSGAVVPGANVTITGTDTGSVKVLTTDSAGVYSLGPLNPGNYTVNVFANGFQRLSVKTVVRTGTATSGNFKLTLGQSSQTVEVNAGALQINTEQAGVSAVITQKQFDTLPVNGRNFLAYAQLQPGVQLQNADNNAGGFDPTKAGYSALSFNGISGRTTRILLDGQDVTDENVGTTIFNITSGSVGEMQVNRSTADVSTDITSTGSVYASTRSGTNDFHGQLFYQFQDHRALFADVKGQDVPFQRNQFGGGVGGPLIKDKLFFFASSERVKQDSSAPTSVLSGSSALFNDVAAAYPNVSTPARDTYSAGRLDYNGPWGAHYFARVNYEANAFTTGIGYSMYANRDNTPGIAGGADFTTGRFTHSFRLSYEKFHNLITDATMGNSSLYDPFPDAYISFGAQSLRSGPNDNAPQITYQSDKQYRYDGSWTKGKHNIRYGGSINRILAGGYASFFGYAPGVYLSSSTAFTGPTSANPDALGCGGVAGAAPCTSDLANGYHPLYFYVGNGQGVFTEQPGFGLQGGGQGDWRMGLYVADAWKLAPTFTLSLGLRYSRDTGRTDSDLATLPCSDIIADNFSGVPCTGDSPLLDQFGAGLGDRVHQPNKNFGPQVGFTYNPTALPKTVFRGAIGIYYESSVFNNVLFDRPAKLASGKFEQYTALCPYAGSTSLAIPGRGLVSTSSTGVAIADMCAEPLSQAVPDVIQLENDYKTGASEAAGPNPAFIGATLTTTSGSYQLFAPKYKSPYSINFNFGLQHEIATGTVISADYVHNATLRISQSLDANHVGDAAYFNANAAKNAIAATNSSFGCGNSSSQSSIDCAIAAGAAIADYAGNGLDSGATALGGSPASAYGDTPDMGAAFAGVNPNVGVGIFAYPNGKSAYDALQLNLRHQKSHPMRGVEDGTLEVSYAYSRMITTAGVGGTENTSDQFFSPPAYDYRNPTRFMGYGGLDRTNIFSLGGSVTVKHGPRIAFIGHFNSADPTNLTLDATNGGGAGQIFQTDVTGDGTTGDLVPGTNPGAYMRKYGPNSLNKLINNYNSTYAGSLTPAGQAVVSSGLIRADQMAALGAVMPTIHSAPAHAYPNSPSRQLDLLASYPIRLSKIREGMTLEPTIAFYNALNLGNFGDTDGALWNVDDYDTGEANSPYDGTQKASARTVRGIGTFSQGAPRSTEFQLKLNF